MKPMTPYPGDIPGDNAEPREGRASRTRPIRSHIMGRSGSLVGLNAVDAVWRFGFLPESESADSFNIWIDDGQGFVWVLASVHTGHVKRTCRGSYNDLPKPLKRVIDQPIANG